MAIKICSECGTPFDSKGPAVACSDACRADRTRQIDRANKRAQREQVKNKSFGMSCDPFKGRNPRPDAWGVVDSVLGF